MKITRQILLLLIFVTARAAVAQDKPSKILPQLPATGASSTWQMPIGEIQQQVFRYLATHAEREITLPAYPANSLVAWSRQRYDEANKTKDKKAVYIWGYENLLVAQKLVREKKLRPRRQGMLLARDTNTSLSVQLKDTWLYARVLEAFLLPYLDAADDEPWENLSRQRLIEGACSAYEVAGEHDKQIVMLRYLLKIVEADDLNTLDWAHGQLAQALSSQGKYEEAIKELNAISDDMNQVKTLIPEYEKKLAEQQQKQKDAAKQRGAKD